MINRVVGNKSLPTSIREDIVERTDGVPLFVEEMTKAVLEAQGEGTDESTLNTIPSSSIGVPASLHASLMARLDRLGPAKEVAQIGAAIGREFSHGLLQAVVRKPDAELQSALDRIVAAGLLFRQRIPPYATYLFKHVLGLVAKVLLKLIQTKSIGIQLRRGATGALALCTRGRTVGSSDR